MASVVLRKIILCFCVITPSYAFAPPETENIEIAWTNTGNIRVVLQFGLLEEEPAEAYVLSYSEYAQAFGAASRMEERYGASIRGTMPQPSYLTLRAKYGDAFTGASADGSIKFFPVIEDNVASYLPLYSDPEAREAAKKAADFLLPERDRALIREYQQAVKKAIRGVSTGNEKEGSNLGNLESLTNRYAAALRFRTALEAQIKALQLAQESGVSSVAVPVMSVEHDGLSIKQSVAATMAALKQVSFLNPETSIQTVKIVVGPYEAHIHRDPVAVANDVKRIFSAGEFADIGKDVTAVYKDPAPIAWDEMKQHYLENDAAKAQVSSFSVLTRLYYACRRAYWRTF